jgi:hypothetical protein
VELYRTELPVNEVLRKKLKAAADVAPGQISKRDVEG